MRGFLRDLAGFLALQALVLAGLQAFYADHVLRHHYFAAWRDKQALLAACPPPRLLMVGGSSLAFGVDSGVLEQAAGRPVVNLGLHAGFGLEFILRAGEEAARAGDLVVLAIEGPLLDPDFRSQGVTVLELLDAAPEAARFLPLEAVPALLEAGLEFVGKRPRALALWAAGRTVGDPVYMRSAFDSRGDAVSHLNLASRQGGGRHGGFPPTSAQAQRRILARLNLFAERVGARGARAAFVMAPVPEDSYRLQERRLDVFRALLRRKLRMPLLQVPLFYPRHEFFDTAFHLTAEGRQHRTEALVRALQQARLIRPIRRKRRVR